MEIDLESLLIYCYISCGMTDFWFVFEPQILLRYAADMFYPNMCLQKLISVASELLLSTRILHSIVWQEFFPGYTRCLL
jgi:hypothetical protein